MALHLKPDRFVAYYRVSTAQQGRSGLGLEAQREAVRVFLDGSAGALAEAFTEVESGKNDDRPQLARALDTCRLTGAVLVIAKLDRLSRDAHFLLGLEKAGVEFVAADMPNANRLTVRLMAVIAQEEREMISARTKAALAAAKARGKKLGGNRGGPKGDYRGQSRSHPHRRRLRPPGRPDSPCSMAGNRQLRPCRRRPEGARHPHAGRRRLDAGRRANIDTEA
jgi:DNA invertase Pin-like site-specific DNA recombinase